MCSITGTQRNTDEFVRVYQVRGPQLMWLLGAGASANAPTAAYMILEFKVSLYASRERVCLVQIGDLADPADARDAPVIVY